MGKKLTVQKKSRSWTLQKSFFETLYRTGRKKYQYHGPRVLRCGYVVSSSLGMLQDDIIEMYFGHDMNPPLLEFWGFGDVHPTAVLIAGLMSR